MNRERLLALANHLDGLGPNDKHFDMNRWCATKKSDGLDLYVQTDDEGRVIGYKRATCGFSACAMGHAVSVPMLREAGLTLLFDKGDHVAEIAIEDEVGNELTGFPAAMYLFDINSRTAEFLFDPTHYQSVGVRNPVVVAERIRGIVEGTVQVPARPRHWYAPPLD